MKRTTCWTPVVLVLSAILLGSLSGSPSSAGGETAAAPDGKALFLGQKCNMCHGVPAAGIKAQVASEKIAGPAITDATSRFEPELLAKFLRKQGQLEGKSHGKEFKGSDEELKALVDWMGRQKPKPAE